ncbi:HD domain-containing phosphohydrolase [Hydrogenoanaerobacterium sp.]|uniref:HD domain-containing phosphohydrolase n=1 Tax=Hydrogenoanaerobacterium sp. TaxID=2953763 RepID=UPI0028994963|nr:HD domain-containing phosphohydrolase [Hydrogenoanaerobacterium sp.]
MKEKTAFFEAEAKRTGYLAFAFADKNGDAIVFNAKRETTNISSRDYFQTALNGEPAVSDLIISSATRELVLIFAAPVYKQGAVVGVIYGRRNGHALSEIISEVSYKQTGYAYMVNNQGVTVAHKNTDLVLAQDNDIENMKTDESLRELGELTKSMTTRAVGSGTYTYNGVKKIVGYAPIADTQWIVAYGLEEAEALGNVRTLSKMLWVFVLGAGVIGVVITYIVSARISDPLIKICKEMEDYSNNISISLPQRYLERNDEIGILSKGITLMLNHISSYISKLKEKNRELLNAKEVINSERLLFETTLHSLGDGVISTDQNGNVQIMNEVAENLTGWTSNDAHGLPFETVFNIINEFTREKCPSPIKKSFENGKINELDDYTVLISKNGDEIPIEDSTAPILDSEGNITGAVIVFRDYTDKKQKQAEISYLSYHDPLTGLYNRHFFEEELKRLDTKHYLPLSLAMFDVNGLKLTNDAFGHQMGDKLLQIVAETIKNSCREDDILSRIGGDEFVVLLPKTSYIETETIVKRIYRKFEQISLNEIVISVSAGWETKNSNEQNIMEIYAKAEESMYRKKLIESQSMRNKTIQVILKTLNETNQRERIHSENVSKISREIGEALNFDQELLHEVEMAGLLHDIGKIAIDNNLLNKPDKLTNSEYEVVKRHTEIGYYILKSADAYSSISDYVLAHHERWDGAGYPRGIKGKEIPLVARIITIADAYEAMTAERTYRKTISKEDAFNELRRCAGTQFDPDIIRVFCEDAEI